MVIEMAQNEAEGAQAVILASFTEDVHNVTWSVVNLSIGTNNQECGLDTNNDREET